MTAQPGLHQSSLNSGEIGAELYTRIDLKQWYQGAKRIRNAEPVPQGGFKLMPGSRRFGRVRGGLTERTGTVTTNAGPHSSAATVKTLSFAATRTIGIVEISGFHASAATGAIVTVQYQDPDTSAWHDFAPAFALPVLAANTRTRLAARAPGADVAAAAVRVRASGMSGSVTVTVGGLAAWSETSAPAGCELMPFTFSASEVYDFVCTPGLIDVWRNGAYAGAAKNPFASLAEVRAAKSAQQFDTMMLFHRDRAPYRVMRRGGDHEWQYGAIAWDAIPDVDYGGSYAKVDDKWDIFIRWSDTSKPDLYLVLALDDEETESVVLEDSDTNYAAWRTRIKNAIEALPSMKPGVTVASATGAKLLHVTITFGGDNSGIAFQLSAQIVNTATASALASHIRIGDSGGEPVMSESRGWPAAGRLFQDRLLVAGFRSKPAAVAASRTGEYFDLNIKALSAAAPLLLNIGTDAAEQINHLVVARHLLVFTDASEYFVSDRVIVRTEPVNFVNTSTHGAHPDATIVEIDGEIFYVAKEGMLIYAAGYNDVTTQYDSEPASLLASHLMDGLRDLALQKASEGSDAARLFVLRADGRLLQGVVIRNQDVLGFSEWATDGAVDSLAVNGRNRVVLAVTRAAGEGAAIFLEEFDDDLLFHAAIERALEPAATTVDGLDWHEGQTVWAEADGFIHGPFTVEGGAIELPVAAAAVTVGRWIAPFVETLPQVRVVRDGVVLLRPGRIHTVRAAIVDTTSIAIGANGDRPRDVGLYLAGMPTDEPPPGVSRWVEASGIPGYVDEGPTAVFTQVRPGRLRVTGWALERA